MAYTLGIDFGTSTTRVALCQENTVPQAIPIGLGGELFMPSVVAYRKGAGGGVEVAAVGEDALNTPNTQEVKVIEEVKRCLIAAERTESPSGIRNLWWDEESRCIRLWDSEIRADKVAYDIINEALRRASDAVRQYGMVEAIDHVSIRGLPCRLGTSVNSGLIVRKELAELANHLDFPEVRVSHIVEEPVLAALGYVSLAQVQPGERVLVYDFGGGTFDVAIVDVEDARGGSPVKLTILAADGEPFLGGSDIDDVFLDYIINRIAKEVFDMSEGELRSVLDDEPEENQALRNQVRRLKETLSYRKEASLYLLSFLGDPLEIMVTSEELEAEVNRSGILAKSFECARRAFRRAVAMSQGGLFAHDPMTGRLSGSVFGLGDAELRDFVHRILVVGGTTRMPLIRNTIAKLWGEEAVIEESAIDPIVATVLGAAWQREDMSGIIDRLPFSIVLERNHVPPLELYEAYTPTAVHHTLTTQPRIICYRFPFDTPKQSDKPRVCCYDPEGRLLEDCELHVEQQPRLFLEIDLFGRCVIKTEREEVLEIPNFMQHSRQKDLWAQYSQVRNRLESEKQQRGLANIRRGPYLNA